MDVVALLDNSPQLQVLRAQHVIELEPGEVSAILEMIVHDGKGNITSYKRMKSKSFVQQFLQLLFLRAAGKQTAGTTYSITDTTPAARNTFVEPGQCRPFACNAAAAAITNGIVIGTDNTPVAVNQTKLVAIIAHATMNYSAMVFAAPGNDASISQFRMTRDFTNVSGIGQTVQEVGLYVIGWDAVDRYFMTIRDVTGGIAVPNGQTLTINYQIQTTV